MPGKNGKDAYNEIKSMKSRMKAIFMSGYPADVINKKTILNEGVDFVSKPVSPTEILKKVREMLDK